MNMSSRSNYLASDLSDQSDLPDDIKTDITGDVLLDKTMSMPENGPDYTVDIHKTFAIDHDGLALAFSIRTPCVPTIDPYYHFDRETTMAILVGFNHNRRVLIQGYHGTGKSTHIEQVAARLNWPLLRINLDSHITRVDLIGRDAITLKDGKQVTTFQEGLLPWALRRPIGLVFDEYDAGRPDVMFVIQRILESHGNLTLLDSNRVLTPHPAFRLFATTNTIGLGDTSGLYHGTFQLNQGQMDRWNVIACLNYLSYEDEIAILRAKIPAYATSEGQDLISRMVQLAQLTRQGFSNGDLSTVMSPRTVISWAENCLLLNHDKALAFCLSFFNRCDDTEKALLRELYQRCFGEDLDQD